jgi:DNA end-binding protein Ku
MAARASGTGTISFGLVTIPVKVYPATTTHGIGFHFLHKKCGTRLKMQYVCPYDGEIVERAEFARGFEYAKEQYVEISDEELDRLRPEKTERIDLVEFVPAESVDFLYIERTSYLGAEKTGVRAYQLLAHAMGRMKRVGVGRYGARGKDQLVLLRPYRGGLVMHQLHYADEVRSFEEVVPQVKANFQTEEEALADRLIDQLSVTEFDAKKYHDDYQERLLAAIERKVAGEEIQTAAAVNERPVVDLFEALRKSVETQPAEGKKVAESAPESGPGLKKAPSKRGAKERERKAG